MGYDLNLSTANDEQIDFLKFHPDYTRHFLEARRPTKTEIVVETSWFRKHEAVKTEMIEVNCLWPESPPDSVQLYLRANLYFLLNGTHDKVDAITNFPNVGARYRGEMLGNAIELGEVGLGRVHAFKSKEVMQLNDAVIAIDQALLESRVLVIAAEIESKNVADDARADMATLRNILEVAVAEKCGLIWFWA